MISLTISHKLTKTNGGREYFFFDMFRDESASDTLLIVSFSTTLLIGLNEDKMHSNTKRSYRRNR